MWGAGVPGPTPKSRPSSHTLEPLRGLRSVAVRRGRRQRWPCGRRVALRGIEAACGTSLCVFHVVQGGEFAADASMIVGVDVREFVFVVFDAEEATVGLA